MKTRRRPNPRVALDHILAARNYEDALSRMNSVLARTWDAGQNVGWQNGVSDANDDEPTFTPNPYRSGASSV